MPKLKSRRKLRPMKVKGKVFDPMPRAPSTPTHAARVTHTRKLDVRGFTIIPSIEQNLRKVRVFKSGKRRITF